MNDEPRQDGPEEEPPELAFSFAAGWPDEIIVLCRNLFAFDMEEVEGKDRLGALAFTEAPPLIEDIRTVVRDLAPEPWAEMPSGLTGALPGQLSEVNNVVDAMVALSSEQQDAQAQRDSQLSQLRERRSWFHDDGWPHARRALIDRRLDERGEEAPGDEQLSALRAEFVALKKEADEVRRELEARRDLANQFREAGRASASEDLEGEFRTVASTRGETARTWLIALCISGVVAAIGAIVIFREVRSEGTNNDPDFAALGLGIFLLGLLAFGVRVCAQNYRVSRHQQAVADSKASALSTFQRLVGSVEEAELRSAVTLAVAQAVFSSEETGLVDSSGDHVTLVERALLPRLPGGPTGA